MALHESKTFNLAILNALPAEIAVLDGVIIAVNDSWRRFALENGIEDLYRISKWVPIICLYAKLSPVLNQVFTSRIN